MSILWITNILFPEAMYLLTGNGELSSSGGWLLGASEALLSNNDIRLSVATVSKHVSKLTCLQGKRIKYYIIPMGKGNMKKNREYEQYWKRINEDLQPNIVHIHGTEFTHGLAWVDACGGQNVVVSIQGLLTGIAPLCNQGLKIWDILKNLTLYEIYKRDVLFASRHYRLRSRYEQELLSKVNHVIGRTTWDKAHVLAINSTIKYYHCDETLRNEFYSGEWQYEKCVKHRIFLSQASYPLKGLHIVLRSLPLILRYYPDTTVHIAGGDITRRDTLRDYMVASAFSEYIRKEIKKMGLKDKVIFIGSLNAEQMKKEYLDSNVFLCPSSVENSPNSLCEAQILGTPIVASYAGGIPDLMKGNEEYLYSSEDEVMLSYKICNIFEKGNVQNNMSKIALNRHDNEKNAMVLKSIYSVVLG